MRQSALFDVDKKRQADSTFFVVGALFITREIDVALADTSHATIDAEARCVSLQLPVSNKGPRAVGCIRTLGCSCRNDEQVVSTCRYHAVVAQLALPSSFRPPTVGRSPAVPFKHETRGEQGCGCPAAHEHGQGLRWDDTLERRGMSSRRTLASSLELSDLQHEVLKWATIGSVRLAAETVLRFHAGHNDHQLEFFFSIFSGRSEEDPVTVPSCRHLVVQTAWLCRSTAELACGILLDLKTKCYEKWSERTLFVEPIINDIWGPGVLTQM